jgi:hypothetical protein
MSGGFLRIAVAVVILVHGIGHALFLAPCLGITQWGQSAHSWLLTGLLGGTATRLLGGLLWLAVIVGFAAAGVGLLAQSPWWRTVAMISAGVSLLALALFAGSIDTQPIASAAGMDLVILVALLWLRWPSVELLGA